MSNDALGESAMSKTIWWSWRPQAPWTSTIDNNMEKLMEIIINHRQIPVSGVGNDHILHAVHFFRYFTVLVFQKLYNFEWKIRLVVVAESIWQRSTIQIYSNVSKQVRKPDWTIGRRNKAQMSQWGLLEFPTPKKTRQFRSNVMVKLIVFFKVVVFIKFGKVKWSLRSTTH